MTKNKHSNFMYLQKRRYRLVDLLVCMVISMLSVTFAQAQTSEFTHSEINAPNAKLTLSLDNADVIDLVRWASRSTTKSIILHPNVSGRITVVAGDAMTQRQAYQLFLSVLQVHNLALVDDGDALMVVPGDYAKSAGLPISETPNIKLNQDMVIQLVKVENVSTQDVVQLLRPLMPQTAYIAAYPSSDRIIIADRAKNITRLLDIIRRVDQASEFDVTLIELEFASANDIANLIQQLIPKQDSSELNVAVDERLNALMVTGDSALKKRVIEMVKRLDKPRKGSGNTQVFKVDYADAESLLPLLQTVADSMKKQSGNQSAEKIDIGIQVNTQTNAVVVTGPPSVHEEIKTLIAQLDQPRSQVLVEAVIVEVNQDTANDLGVEWSGGSLRPTGEGVLGGFNFFPANLAPLTVNNDGDLSLGTGASFGYYKDGGLRGLINALKGESNANILSTPSILALDNEEAEILVGENVPFITGTEEREGDTPFQTIQRQDIGITLKIKPRINNDQSVTLDIQQSVESIGQTAATTADIITNKREIKTRVHIGHNQTIVLGGLIRDEATESENKIPLLGDIPLVGKAFKSTSTRIVKRNLMVFLHPVILNTREDTDRVSFDYYQDIVDQQTKFGRNIDLWERYITLDNYPQVAPVEERFPATMKALELEKAEELARQKAVAAESKNKGKEKTKKKRPRGPKTHR